MSLLKNQDLVVGIKEFYLLVLNQVLVSDWHIYLKEYLVFKSEAFVINIPVVMNIGHDCDFLRKVI